MNPGCQASDLLVSHKEESTKPVQYAVIQRNGIRQKIKETVNLKDVRSKLLLHYASCLFFIDKQSNQGMFTSSSELFFTRKFKIYSN